MSSKKNDAYRFVRKLQAGSYGSVLEVEKNNERFAIKEFKMSSDKSKIVGVMYLNEVDFLRRCDHDNILKLLGVSYGIPYTWEFGDEVSSYTCDNIYLIMPLAEMSLYEYIRMDYASVPMLKRFMVQLVSAANYLHVRGVGHRDFKSPNVLIFKDESYPEALNVKLCDFGMCKQFVPDIINSGHVGTDRYKAPELLLGRRTYSEAIDVWALGVIFFEMFNKCWPFEKQLSGSESGASLEILTKIFTNRGAPSFSVYTRLVGGKNNLISFDSIKKWSPKPISSLFDEKSDLLVKFCDDSVELPNFGTREQYDDLLEGMLRLDPGNRLTITEIQSHPFFSLVPREEPTSQIWRGLYIKHEEPPNYHILTKTKNDARRNIGIALLNTVQIGCHHMMYRILFQALDIFDRCLLFIDNNANYNDTNTRLLAFSSFYIAAKLFLNDYVPEISTMIFNITFERSEILTMERIILEIMLEWRIYRITVYDLLKNKSLAPNTLWIVMTTKLAIYGSDVMKIADIYTKKVKH
jgi:mitogen-activated protein kinase 1/3